MFLEMIKSIVLGIVEGISEWLPISSTGHMILVNELINNTEGFTASDLYLYVIQLGAILAVVTLYFHKLNPFSPKKTNVEKENTWKMWFKERKGVQVEFSYARDDDFYFSVSLDKFSSNDERWGMTDFRIGKDSWATFKRENLNLNFEEKLFKISTNHHVS